MCTPYAGRDAGGAAGTPGRLERSDLDRRTVLRLGAAGGAGVVLSTALGTPALAAKGRKRAYVFVLDGMIPGEIDSGLMPQLKALRDGGSHFPNARSLPIMETIPNHVMMMTGVRPDRNGVPANAIYDRRAKVVRDLDRPKDLRFPTILQRLRRQGFSTGTVLSKEYLYGIFGARADHRWEPFPIIPISGHAPDLFTMQALNAMVGAHDPNLVFVNLGDCDRWGHTDITGTTLRALRTAALIQLDLQIGQFVAMLRRTGRWRNSLLVFLADHSMDWSRPDRVITLSPRLARDPLLAGRVEVSQNGGADLLYWTGPRARRAEAVRRMRKVALATPGVLSAHAPKALRLGPEAGDLVVYCRAGWRFSDPTPISNPIPGNHGHPATAPIPFFLAGGHPAVKRRRSAARAQTIDVAPTVGEFFGLGAPRGGYDGISRLR